MSAQALWEWASNPMKSQRQRLSEARPVSLLLFSGPMAFRAHQSVPDACPWNGIMRRPRLPRRCQVGRLDAYLPNRRHSLQGRQDQR